jgi:hypothetical protein
MPSQPSAADDEEEDEDEDEEEDLSSPERPRKLRVRQQIVDLQLSASDSSAGLWVDRQSVYRRPRELLTQSDPLRRWIRWASRGGASIVNPGRGGLGDIDSLRVASNQAAVVVADV